MTDRRGPGGPRTCDVLVVGAGPAGIAAALTAAGRGLAVRVVDKAGFPRDKTCGDGLTAGALRRLEALGLDLRRLAGWSPVDETVVVAPSGRRVHLPLPAGPGHWSVVVPRRALDSALVDLARERGVTVEERTSLVAVDRQDPVDPRAAGGADGADAAVAGELESDGRRSAFRARFVIAADGHWSATRRLVASPTAERRDPGEGGIGDGGEWAAFRQYWRGVADPRLWVIFDSGLIPGYAWVFPLPGGRANVGFGLPRRPGLDGKALARIWRELPDLPSVRAALGPAAEPDGPTRAWPIPSGYDPSRLADGRVLYAGDAAAVVDPMTGEGVAQALETGVLAATAVADASGDPAVAYSTAVERALGADLRFSRLLQRALAHRRGAEWSLRIVDLNDWTRRNFARWMWEDYPRGLVLTPGRWRGATLRGRGAYPDIDGTGAAASRPPAPPGTRIPDGSQGPA